MRFVAGPAADRGKRKGMRVSEKISVESLQPRLFGSVYSGGQPSVQPTVNLEICRCGTPQRSGAHACASLAVFWIVLGHALAQFELEPVGH